MDAEAVEVDPIGSSADFTSALIFSNAHRSESVNWRAFLRKRERFFSAFRKSLEFCRRFKRTSFCSSFNLRMQPKMSSGTTRPPAPAEGSGATGGPAKTAIAEGTQALTGVVEAEVEAAIARGEAACPEVAGAVAAVLLARPSNGCCCCRVDPSTS